MPETLQDACTPIGARVWHWYMVQRDLVQQGGLEDKDVMIDPFTGGQGGKFKDMPFFITWAKDQYLLLSSEKFIPELVDAFSKVVEYKPFVRYVESDSDLITVEWDKLDPNGRYQVLEKENKRQLTRLLE
jgi:hypothetical protein